MTPIREILAAATPIEGGFRAQIPSDWLQGRTAYGGLSSALALHAAQGIEPDLPPLRSAQVSFIGPLSGDVRVTATKLRRGRTAAFIQADIVSDAGLGYRAVFVFMAEQPSRVALSGGLAATLPPPAADAKLYTGPDEFFTGNFNFLDLKAEAPGEAEWLRWARLRDYAGIDPMVEVLALADALPPAAFKLFGKEFVPLSSVTWIVNLLTPTPATTDGWWLLSAESQHAVNGGSSQTMMLWNADGVPIAQGMQSVAIFG
ncbi:thioesterase family protein [Sphingomonas sp. AAP5]|jgi:acyl-CoA thioesterase|uniref:thioesterase family protein n=1 Tax=unclassified Sphingomonas TaxID=196159 RepID=UPI0010571610|nr:MULTISPECIES: thioesterase family protein [unclassified Sphingomonas]MDY7522783.1 thioesterase family protein [Sphingomonas sp. 10B4]MEB0282626.1 thioesterase family protein [Sphingomonas sp. 10B4]QBM74767.1 thioesterase family protein [Sphingomonas sp. AAP5]